MASIPASQLVTVNPGVVGTGGSPLSLNSVFLTTSTLVPTNTVMPFYDSASVASFFGSGSTEAQLAAKYFLGFDNSNRASLCASILTTKIRALSIELSSVLANEEKADKITVNKITSFTTVFMMVLSR